MTQFVLDASVALGWFIDQPVPAVALRVRKSLLDGAKALVPFFWHLEIANGFLVAERRKLITSDDVNRCVSEIEYLLASVIETRGDAISIRKAISVSRSHRIAAYDAIYLDLARSERMPLATLDQKLRTTAMAAGINVVR